MREAVRRLAAGAGLQPDGERVECHGAEEHQARDDVDPAVRDLQRVEAVLQRSDQHRAESAPRTSPRPPKSETPPMTADAIAFSSRFPGGNVSATELTWAEKMIPPMPAVAPEIMNTRILIRGTLMPARRAASVLPPTA